MRSSSAKERGRSTGAVWVFSLQLSLSLPLLSALECGIRVVFRSSFCCAHVGGVARFCVFFLCRLDTERKEKCELHQFPQFPNNRKQGESKQRLTALSLSPSLLLACSTFSSTASRYSVRPSVWGACTVWSSEVECCHLYSCPDRAFGRPISDAFSTGSCEHAASYDCPPRFCCYCSLCVCLSNCLCVVKPKTL